MTEEYKKGLLTGLALQPLYVVQGNNDNKINLSERFEPISVCGMRAEILEISDIGSTMEVIS